MEDPHTSPVTMIRFWSQMDEDSALAGLESAG